MKVILHADDFGFNHDTTQATIDLLECGALTSATIMATMPAAEEAIEYARLHPQMSFGVHLTYVDGISPMLSKSEIPSLVNDAGLFLESNAVRKKALKMGISKNEIVMESIAQIKYLQDSGMPVSHIDSHGHLHKFPSFLFALKDISSATGVRKVRRVQNFFIEKPRFGPAVILNKMFGRYISNNFISTDYFYMSANNMDTGWSDAIIRHMDTLPDDAIIEVGVHPGYMQSEKEGWRVAEYHDIKIFADKIRNHTRHKIITWNDL